MSKKQIKESFLNEGLLDTVFKGVLTFYFGGKMIDKYARKQAMKDPEIQKHLKKVKGSLEAFDAIMAKYK